VWHADGSGWFETPLPLTGTGLTALFFAPFVAPLFTLGNKKRAAYVFAATAVIAVLVFLRSRWTPVLVPHLAAYSAPFLLFGLFWLGTGKLAWPTLLRHRPRTMARRIAALVVTCLVVWPLNLKSSSCMTFFSPRTAVPADPHRIRGILLVSVQGLPTLCGTCASEKAAGR